jgi:hypothetical protein
VDEGNSRSLRSGRDDNSVCALRVCYGGFGKSEGRTADPSASLGMTRGSAVLSGETGLWMRGTAGHSASLGMTKGSAVLSGEIGLWMRGTAGPSALRDVDERS